MPLCRYANSAAFISEMEGLTLFDSETNTEVPGDELAEESNLNNDLSVAANLCILAGMLVFLRVAALLGLKFAYRVGWM